MLVLAQILVACMSIFSLKQQKILPEAKTNTHVMPKLMFYYFTPCRNPTDSILERNDAEFVARVRDAVINELEVFKQSADAYLIWHDTEKSDGAFRRGMTRLRQSFRRQRAPSTSSKERPTKLGGIF